MTQLNALVSVVMPVYNALPWLKEAVDSILSQTYPNLELVVVDDCSTDGSLAVLNEYAQRDSRVRVIENAVNSGVPASLNKGIELSRGTYIARMDADDISEPQRLEVQAAHLESHPECGVVGSWIHRMRQKGDVRLKTFPEHDQDLKLMLMFECCFSHPAVMIRKSALKDLAHIYDEMFRSAQDYELWSRLQGTCDFYCIQAPLLWYRELASSVSKQAKKKNLKRERVRQIHAFLFKANGINQNCSLDLHEMIVNRESRGTLRPRDIQRHLDYIFAAFPDASYQQEVQDHIFSQFSKNPVFRVRRWLSRLRSAMSSNDG